MILTACPSGGAERDGISGEGRGGGAGGRGGGAAIACRVATGQGRISKRLRGSGGNAVPVSAARVGFPLGPPAFLQVPSP